VQLYGEQKKFKQKMSYADKIGVPYAIFLGEDELNQGKCSVKDMRTGQQSLMTPEEAAAYILEGVSAKNIPIILEK
jgi:histidyl-tRNA synthetase